MPLRFPVLAHKINWTTSAFLIGTVVLSLTALPVYLALCGWSWFLFALFLFFFTASGMSITLGYHRLFAHHAFRARWPVRLVVLLFGSSAFEHSVLLWASEHRRHHLHVDHDDDPYDINKGFFYAHIGWLLFKVDSGKPGDNVADLRRDPLVVWQHRYIHQLAVGVGLVLPAILGAWYFAVHGGAHHGPGLAALWRGALGGFLCGGVARVVAIQHCTFFINSACHTLGKQPYSSRCSARDSWLMALLTFGEGYHNYHHEFPSDYRNGVKPWQFDPTKWAIWVLNRVGLADGLRQISAQKIQAAERAEAQRHQAARAARLQPPVATGDAGDPGDALPNPASS